MTQYLYHFAEKTEKRRISEYIVHFSYFLKTYLCQTNRNQFLLFWKHDINQKQVWTKMIPLKSILHTENISVTFYTSNRYLLWQQMSKQPLNCLLKLPKCLPHGYKTDVKRVTVYWTLHEAFCKCSGWLDDIFHRQYHDVKVTLSNLSLIHIWRCRRRG